MRRRLLPPALAVLFLVFGYCQWLGTPERDGRFTIHQRRLDFAGHTATTLALRLGPRLLTTRLGDWSVNPHDPSCALYATSSSVREYRGKGTYYVCGLFGRQKRISRQTLHVRSPDEYVGAPRWMSRWSPDGRHVLLEDEKLEPAVYDLATGAPVMRLAAATGARDLRALAWSPSGRRIAVVVETPVGTGSDQDLVAVDMGTGAVEYVATRSDARRRGALRWNARDFAWAGERLAPRGDAERRARSALHWRPPTWRD